MWPGGYRGCGCDQACWPGCDQVLDQVETKLEVAARGVKAQGCGLEKAVALRCSGRSGRRVASRHRASRALRYSTVRLLPMLPLYIRLHSLPGGWHCEIPVKLHPFSARATPLGLACSTWWHRSSDQLTSVGSLKNCTKPQMYWRRRGKSCSLVGRPARVVLRAVHHRWRMSRMAARCGSRPPVVAARHASPS